MRKERAFVRAAVTIAGKVRRAPYVAGLAALLAAVTLAPRALADAALLKEMEALRASLPAGDTGQMRALTERLANLYYNEAISVAADDPAGHAAELTRLRERGIALYRDLLAGGGGAYEKPSAEAADAAKFYMARLLSDNGATDDAEVLYRELATKATDGKIIAESAMTLGETAEQRDPASAEALKDYTLAIKHERRPDTLAYAQYRRAWVERNQGNFTAALADLHAALLDPRGKPREEVLSDLIVFYSLSDLPAKQAMAAMEQLATKLGQPTLLNKLADAYVAAGNKAAAVAALGAASAKGRKDPLQLARLAEESFGIRDLEQLHRAVAEAVDTGVAGLSDADTKKVLGLWKRLAVQLDAAKETEATMGPEFARVADLMLGMFPKDSDNFKLASGRLGLAASDAAKIALLTAWIGAGDTPPATGPQWQPSERRQLREHLIGALQRTQKHAEAAAVAHAAAHDAATPADARRLTFVEASERYDAGDHPGSLPLFRQLVEAQPGDEIGAKSQMLVVRMMGASADYASAVAASDAWVKAVADKPELTASKEYRAIVEVRDRAAFEAAVGLGETKEALATFTKFCLGGAFLPQSCDNARGMAVRLRDFGAAFAVLKHESKDDEILALSEERGFFADAAKTREAKLGAATPLAETLHVSVLYELGGKDADRDRVLRTLAAREAKAKQLAGTEEAALYAALGEAGLLDAQALRLPWSETHRCALLEQVATGHDAAATRDLLKCPQETGPAWSGAVVAQLRELDAAQRKITFYGKASKRRFEQRLAAMKKLGTAIEQRLAQARGATYTTLATLGRDAYKDLNAEVLATPIPADVPEDARAQVAVQLAEMGSPFAERAQAFEALLAKPDGANAGVVAGATDAAAKGVEGAVAGGAIFPVKAQPVSAAALAKATATLQQTADERASLEALRVLFDGAKRQMAVRYLEGRMAQLAPGKGAEGERS